MVAPPTDPRRAAAGSDSPAIAPLTGYTVALATQPRRPDFAVLLEEAGAKVVAVPRGSG